MLYGGLKRLSCGFDCSRRKHDIIYSAADDDDDLAGSNIDEQKAKKEDMNEMLRGTARASYKRETILRVKIGTLHAGTQERRIVLPLACLGKSIHPSFLDSFVI